MIRSNAHKYSLSAMCEVLQIPRSSYFYQVKKREDDQRQAEEADVQERLCTIFMQSRTNHETRKIK
ncbi:hypothetical protein JOC78_000612 [Bacillus ectoiniformans]|uniref:hypothetical protein n=1 Tax=Bacillus ectoiniformans TaxID=1494429 RepID=UPI00195D5723|nr:hypothetical protein [Bacillus ectoiniformans]MBM7647691.1 hypothetical protein [Bacillus ectoiniformans]